MHATFKNLTEQQLLELQDDPLAKETGTRLFIGMTNDEPPFNKSHIEISYMDENEAKHYFIEPAEGSLPREGTDEAATDTRVLALLGIEPKVGAKFTIPVGIDENTQDAKYVERTFTLSGWWEYDSAIVASNVILPRSAAEELCGLSTGAPQSQTGKWHLDMMFNNAFHIREKAEQVLANHGYQCSDPEADNYIAIGVNWGYSAAQFDAAADPMSVIAMIAMLLLIMFTGYLIIYNVFQISVTNDIRFYGLLKTIGTTGKQIRRMIRRQAFLLSLFGIPLGWIVGFALGVKLTPIIMEQTSNTGSFVSFNPLIFVSAAVFSLLTVRISCRKPGKMAARVSPVEAVRYTDAGVHLPKARCGKHAAHKPSGARLPHMAWANLGRSRGKTVITVISLALAVVLMQMTYTFAIGFDMDKYLSGQIGRRFHRGRRGLFPDRRGLHLDRREPCPKTSSRTSTPSAASLTPAASTGRFPACRNSSPRTGTARCWGTVEHRRSARPVDGAAYWNARTTVCWPTAPSCTAWRSSRSRASPCWTATCPPCPTRTPTAVAAVYTADDYGDPEDAVPLGEGGRHGAPALCGGTGNTTTRTRARSIPRGRGRRGLSGRPRRQLARQNLPRRGLYGRGGGGLIPGSIDYRFYGADQFVHGCRAVQAGYTDQLGDDLCVRHGGRRDRPHGGLSSPTTRKTCSRSSITKAKRPIRRSSRGSATMFLTLGGVH